jgi:hypothetical protein
MVSTGKIYSQHDGYSSISICSLSVGILSIDTLSPKLPAILGSTLHRQLSIFINS